MCNKHNKTTLDLPNLKKIKIKLLKVNLKLKLKRLIKIMFKQTEEILI